MAGLNFSELGNKISSLGNFNSSGTGLAGLGISSAANSINNNKYGNWMNSFNNYGNNVAYPGVTNLQFTGNYPNYSSNMINGIRLRGMFDDKILDISNGMVKTPNGEVPLDSLRGMFTSQDVDLFSGNLQIAQGKLGSSLGNSWLGQNWGVLKDIGQMGLAGFQVYNAMKQNQMLEDQLDFQKGLANRQLANQAKIINDAYDSSARIAAGMGSLDPEVTAAREKQYLAEAKARHIDGSAIG